MSGILVEILNTRTGEMRPLAPRDAWSEERIAGDDEQARGIEIWWSEGNGSCDCNRGAYFDRAGGVEPEIDDHLCSAENAYLVRLTIDDVIVFDEISARR